MTELTPLRHIPTANVFRKGDVFVLFGELFGRGYANGLVDEARDAGMTIVGITVGRRDETGALRALTAEEHAEAEEKLGGRIVNVPLMAGFDMDAPEGEQNPTEMLAGIRLQTWEDDKLDWEKIERCREAGVRRFTTSAAQAMAEIDKLIPEGANVFFAHTMAGGIPKIKAFLAIANRIYKGRGERFMSSRALLESDLGKLILMNFDEVTANTLKYLIDASAPIRERVTKAGGEVRYTAYGYHGTEILIGGEYVWQTYTNYTQGYAKMRLESVAAGGLEPGHRGHRVQLPGNPHQFVRHFRRRRAVAVPAADRPEEGRRRRLGRPAMADLPGPAGRRHLAGVACWPRSSSTTTTPPAPSSATSKPGRWTTRRPWRT